MTALRITTRKVKVFHARCERCGYEWESVGLAIPTRCAGCKRRNWNTAPGSVPMGRPKGKA